MKQRESNYIFPFRKFLMQVYVRQQNVKKSSEVYMLINACAHIRTNVSIHDRLWSLHAKNNITNTYLMVRVGHLWL